MSNPIEDLDLGAGTPIRDLEWERIQRVEIEGWIYPRREVSAYIPALPAMQQAAISLFIVVAIGMVLAGVVLPFFFSAWWAFLIPGALIVWKANRRSMEQFFLEKLVVDREFYEAIQSSALGENVRVVFAKDR